MKVCEKCGIEIFSGDGGNECSACEVAEEKRREKNRRAYARRKERESVLESFGLVKVRGSRGGIYWE